MKRVDVLIIGAGPTGIGAAHWLHEHPGTDWLLCEQRSVVGGLSRSITDRFGYTWDIGGHVCWWNSALFERIVREVSCDLCLTPHKRNAWIMVDNTRVPFPFQAHTETLPSGLPPRATNDALAQSTSPDPSGGEENFASFAKLAFGEFVCDKFMYPYNEKIWQCPLESLSAAWARQSIYVPVADRSDRKGDGQNKAYWGDNNSFVYPASGGIGAFWRTLASHLPGDRVELSRKVVAIDRSSRRVAFADGREVGYEFLVSTMPLPAAVALVGDVGLGTLVARLRCADITVVGLGVSESVARRLGSTTWAYFPQADIPVYRLTHSSLYSRANMPAKVANGGALLAEVSNRTARLLGLKTREELTRTVTRSLMACGVVGDASEVTHSWAMKVRVAYPIPSLDRDEILREVLEALALDGILSRGRLGAWRYEVSSMEKSFLQGYEAAGRVVHGTSELALWS